MSAMERERSQGNSAASSPVLPSLLLLPGPPLPAGAATSVQALTCWPSLVLAAERGNRGNMLAPLDLCWALGADGGGR